MKEFFWVKDLKVEGLTRVLESEERVMNLWVMPLLKERINGFDNFSKVIWAEGMREDVGSIMIEFLLSIDWECTLSTLSLADWISFVLVSSLTMRVALFYIHAKLSWSSFIHNSSAEW
jgi:hypothetical protein